MAMIEIEGLTKHFGSVAAVDDLSLAVDAGEFLTLLGPSGCGKTTVLRMIAGLEVPDAGNWLLDLGQVAHSARIIINANEAGITYAPPHLLDVSRFLKKGLNTLSIEVTNLPQPTPESNAPPNPSGLLGPVRLIPLTD